MNLLVPVVVLVLVGGAVRGGPGELSDGEKTVERPAGLLINGVRWRREPRKGKADESSSEPPILQCTEDPQGFRWIHFLHVSNGKILNSDF